MRGREAAESRGSSERKFRRWRDRNREKGLAGVEDRRLRPSLRRAPKPEIERRVKEAHEHMARVVEAWKGVDWGAYNERESAFLSLVYSASLDGTVFHPAVHEHAKKLLARQEDKHDETAG